MRPNARQPTHIWPSGTPRLASRGATVVPPLCTACQTRQVGRAWPPLRYGMRRATSMPDAAWNAAATMHPAPSTIQSPPATCRMRRAKTRGPRGRPAHCPDPMRPVRARLVQPTHRAAHSARRGAAALPYRARSDMQRATGNTVHRATHARRGTCRREHGASVHTPPQPQLTGIN